MHQDGDDPRPVEQWADDQLDVGMRSDAACLQCHAGFGSREAQQAHSHHAPESSGSRCQACHMPHNAFGLHKATRSHHIEVPTATETAEAGRPNACNLCHLDRTLAWTAQQLEEWYGMPSPELTERERSVAMGVWWVLAGDANQRALAGWHMGYAPAQRASGTDWMVPYLAHLMRDHYEPNRAVALDALRTIPGFETRDVDYVGRWPEGVDAATMDIQRAWIARAQPDRRMRPELLMRANGVFDVQAARELSEQRDRRPIFLAE
jgi:hypothetical protein